MADHWPNKFAGMRTGDIAPWQRFLDRFEDSFAHDYHYNLRVSSENNPVPDLPEELQPMARSIRRKRIDVLAAGPVEPLTWPVPGWCVLDELNQNIEIPGNYLTLIEVKKLATTTAIGQLTTYPVLFRQSFPMTEPIALRVLLVAERLGTDVEFLCKWLGIPYLLFPE